MPTVLRVSSLGCLALLMVCSGCAETALPISPPSSGSLTGAPPPSVQARECPFEPAPQARIYVFARPREHSVSCTDIDRAR